jgi:hypothetical protein
MNLLEIIGAFTLLVVAVLALGFVTGRITMTLDVTVEGDES